MGVVLVQYEPFHPEEDEEDCWIDLTSPQKSPMPIALAIGVNNNNNNNNNTRSLMFIGALLPSQPKPQDSRKCPVITWERHAIPNEEFHDSQEEAINEEESAAEKPTNDATTTKDKEPTTLSEFVEELSQLQRVNQELLSQLQASQEKFRKFQREQEQAMEELQTEVVAAQKHREDMATKLNTKEQALKRARREVDTLKKVIQQNTTMVSMQRDHAVAVMTEKDHIIGRLRDELKDCKRREQLASQSFERELLLLQENLASVDTPHSTTSSCNDTDNDNDHHYSLPMDGENEHDNHENQTPRILKVVTNQQLFDTPPAVTSTADIALKSSSNHSSSRIDNSHNMMTTKSCREDGSHNNTGEAGIVVKSLLSSRMTAEFNYK